MMEMQKYKNILVINHGKENEGKKSIEIK